MQDQQDQPAVKRFPPVRTAIAIAVALFLLYSVGRYAYILADGLPGSTDRIQCPECGEIYYPVAQEDECPHEDFKLKQELEQERLDSETSR